MGFAGGSQEVLKGVLEGSFKGLIRPLKGLIRSFKGLIRPFKGLIRPFKSLIRTVCKLAFIGL